MSVLLVCIQTLVSAALALGGSSTFEYAILPVSVAIYMGTGRTRGALGLIAAAAAGPAIVRAQGLLAAYYAFVAALGIVIGVGAQRRWTYGRIVALCAGAAYSIALVAALATWQDWVAEGVRVHAEWMALFQRSARVPDEVAEQIREQLSWLLLDHWSDLGLGLMFGSTATMVCIGVSWASHRLRRRCAAPAPKGGFRDMRTPDWLIWAAIAIALAWFVDRHRPDMGLRPFVWNAAVGLGAVYWLNGMSIVVFAAGLLGSPVGYVVAVAAGLLACGVYVPFFVGLFDTWADFRRRLAAWRTAGPDTSGPPS